MGAPSPPYDEEEHHMENKRLAQFYKCVEWREKEEKTKGIQEQTCVAMRARTFLTLRPIFGISQISKIIHLVSSRGLPY